MQQHHAGVGERRNQPVFNESPVHGVVIAIAWRIYKNEHDRCQPLDGPTLRPRPRAGAWLYGYVTIVPTSLPCVITNVKLYPAFYWCQGKMMPTKLKVRRIGNSLGVILPREAFERLGVKEGDALYVVEAPGIGIGLTPYDPDFEAALTAFEETRRRYRNALRELAR